MHPLQAKPGIMQDLHTILSQQLVTKGSKAIFLQLAQAKALSMSINTFNTSIISNSFVIIINQIGLLMGKQLKQRKQKPVKIEAKQEVVPEIKAEVKQQIIDAPKATKKIEKQKGKTNRLIIRNLVFDIREKHLRKLFLPFGQITEIQVPINPNNQKCNKGFAFVEFAKYRSCQKAIKQLNQSQYKGRPIIIDYAVAKVRFQTQKMNDNEDNDQIQKKQQIEQEQEQIEEQNNIQEQKPQQIKQAFDRSQQDLSHTIFIRNLPPNVSPQTLKEFLSHYGKVKWARIVMDKQTNTSKGTAFVRYVNNQHAQQLIQYSRNEQLFLLGRNPNFKRDPKINLQIDGTIIKIFPVEKRETIAEKLKERQGGQQQKRPSKLKPLKKIKKLKDLIAYDKQGKRRIALAAAGLWQPQDYMSEEDRERFKRHSKQKIQKLKNPNNVVSNKRVVLKYLDKNVTEQQIRSVAHEFLSANRMPPRHLVYYKLMLDKERQRSAGYAFLEFATSETAIQFVEQLAQNQQALMSRPFVVQFALQDSRKLQKISKSN